MFTIIVTPGLIGGITLLEYLSSTEHDIAHYASAVRIDTLSPGGASIDAGILTDPVAKDMLRYMLNWDGDTTLQTTVDEATYEIVSGHLAINFDPQDPRNTLLIDRNFKSFDELHAEEA